MEKNKAALNLLWFLINHAFFFFFLPPSLYSGDCPLNPTCVRLGSFLIPPCLNASFCALTSLIKHQNYLLVCLTLSKLKNPMSQGLLSWMSVVSSPNSGLGRQ